jgi:hypothetical protein
MIVWYVLGGVWGASFLVVGYYFWTSVRANRRDG